MKSCFTALLGLTFLTGFAQNTTTSDLSPGYYVVVAAYLADQSAFAERYSSTINQEGRHSKYGFDATRKFYYVYLDYYTDFNESVGQMLKARKEGFDKAWVRVMKGQITGEKINVLAENKSLAPVSPVEKKPALNEENAAVAKKDPAPEVKKGEEAKTPAEATQAAAPAKETVSPVASVPAPKAVAEFSNSDPLIHPQLLTDSPVLLTLYNPTNNLQVEGEVEVVNSESAMLIAKAKGNDYYNLPDPKSKSGKLTLISSSFGYRKVQHELNYKCTEKDTLPAFMDVVDNRYRIKFDMDRLHRGDIEVLYNVYFYNDAAVMLPESKYELNKLLQMMKNDPKYKITLHGHTNGNAHGKIITMGNSKDFFTLTSDVKQGFGSAKELSRARAQIIKDWLVANGIAAERMDVQAHGGTRMIHDKNGPNAKRNVRVEVEVMNE
jgi:outer membrane protein OmpA-like peptidoglycan-associated protein